MIPFIEREIVDKHHWIESEDIVDIFAIVQSVPGVIAVNSATFVGYRIAGFAGAFFATLGVVLPSFIVLSVIALFLYEFKDYPYIKEAMYGIKAAVAALMCSAVYKLGKKSVKDVFSWIVCILAFISIVVFGVGAIPVLIVAGIAGLGFTAWHGKNAALADKKEDDK